MPSPNRPFTFTSLSGNSVDAANKIKVSQVTTLADLTQINDNAPVFFDRENIGGATQTYVNGKGGSDMAVSTNLDKAICQQKFANHYFSGKSQQFLVTMANFQPESGVIKRVGYFSSSSVSPYETRDGIYIEASEGTLWLVIEKGGVVKHRAAQADWNLDTAEWLNPQNFTVCSVDFLYLGGTGVRFTFFRGREPVDVHVYDHANSEANVILLSPSQPIRYEIESTGGSGSLTQICSEVGTENAVAEVGKSTGFKVSDFDAQTVGVLYPLIGFRLAANRKLNTVIFNTVQIISSTADDIDAISLLNPTIAGPAVSWGTTDGWGAFTNSILEIGVSTGGAGGNSVTDLGTRFGGATIEGNASFARQGDNSVRLGSKIDGTMDEIWVCGQPKSVNATVSVNVNVTEY